MKYYFIYNSIAGQGKTGAEFLKTFYTIKAKSDLDLNLYETTSVGDATFYAEKICKQNKDEDITIFACGGDGTMNEVLNGIANYPNAILGIVPTGSCNDFLRTFEGYDFLNIINQLEGTVIPMDVLKVNEFYCLNICDIGFDAKVNFDQINYRPQFKTVKGAYKYAIFRNLIRPLGDQVTVKLDGETFFTGKSLLMAFGNGRCYGGGYYCTPKALIDDGLTDICIVKKVSLLKFLMLVKKYKEGKVYGEAKYSGFVKSNRASKIEIESSQILTVCLDGETIHRNHVTIENLKHQIRFILPKK